MLLGTFEKNFLVHIVCASKLPKVECLQFDNIAVYSNKFISQINNYL